MPLEVKPRASLVHNTHAVAASSVILVLAAGSAVSGIGDGPYLEVALSPVIERASDLGPHSEGLLL